MTLPAELAGIIAGLPDAAFDAKVLAAGVERAGAVPIGDPACPGALYLSAIQQYQWDGQTATANSQADGFADHAAASQPYIDALTQQVADAEATLAARTTAGQITVVPHQGDESGGTAVTITGSGFTGTTSVKFGTTSASFTVVNDTQINATSPAGTDLVDVRVTGPSGTSPITISDRFVYTSPAAPTITSVTPNNGSEEGGTAIFITGTGFNGATSVHFGAAPAYYEVFPYTNGTSMQAWAPPGTGGSTVDVSVTTPAGTSPLVAGDHFTYTSATPVPLVSGLSPSSGPDDGGTSVTVTGTGFNGATSVKFGTVAATFSVVPYTNGTQITAVSPGGTGVVNVTVTTPGGTSPVVFVGNVCRFTYTTPVGSSAELNAVKGVLAYYGFNPPAGATTAAQITNGRQTLTSNRHYLYPATIDHTGQVDVSAAVQAHINTYAPTVASPTVTIDAWPNGLYLQDDTIWFRSTSKRYNTTVNLHGATTRTKPTIELGNISLVNGSTTVTRAAGQTFPTDGSLHNRPFNLHLDGVGMLQYNGNYIVSNTATTLTINLPARQTVINRACAPSCGTAAGDIGFRNLTRKLWAFEICYNCRLTNGTIKGCLPLDWNYTDRTDLPQFSYNTEQQHGIEARGSVDLTIDNLNIYDVFGDFVRTSEFTKTQNNLRTKILNNYCRRAARTGLSPISGTDALWDNNDVSGIGRTGMDMESNYVGAGATGYPESNLRCTISNNTFGGWRFNTIGSVCDGDNRDILIDGNHQVGRAFQMDIMARQFVNAEKSKTFTPCTLVAGSKIVTNHSALSFAGLVTAGRECGGFGIPPGTTVASYQSSTQFTMSNPATASTSTNSVTVFTSIRKPASKWADWTITNNTGEGVNAGNGNGWFIRLQGVDNFTLTNNREISFRGGMYGCTGSYIGGTIVVKDNVYPNCVAQAIINGVPMGSMSAGIPAAGCLWGAAVNPKPPQVGTLAQVTAALETKLGATMAAHRLYCQPSGGFLPNQRAAELADDTAHSRTSFLSLALPAGATWASMTANTALLQASADQLATLTGKVVIMADHEPDVTANGTPAEYAAFMTAYFTRVRATAKNVTTAVAFGGYKLYAGTLSQAQYIAYLPTNKALVDLIGWGPYNDNATPGGPAFASLMAKPELLLAAYGKHGFIHEMGIHLAAGNRGPWWTAAFAHVKYYNSTATQQIKAMMAFHATGGAALDPLHDYWIDDDTTLLNAVKATAGGSGDAYFHPLDG